MRKTLIATFTVVGLVVGTLFVSGPAASTISYVPTFATFAGTPFTTGALGSANITVSSGAFNKEDTSIPPTNWVPTNAPLPINTLAFVVTSVVTFSFSEPVTNPALYLVNLPSQSDDLDALDLSSTGGTCTWSKQSGFLLGSLTGSTFVPANDYSEGGVLLCSGTVSSITITPTASGSEAYSVGLASLIDPSSTTTTSTIDPTTTTTPAVDPVVPEFTG